MVNTIHVSGPRRAPEWQSRANCIGCSCRDMTMFAGLSHELLQGIDLPIDRFSMPPRTILFRQGEQGRYLYTIRAGLIKLVQKTPNGTARIVGLLRNYAVAGLSTLIDNTYRHTAEVLLPAEICRIPVPVVKDLSGKHPPMQHHLMKIQQDSLDKAEQIITLLTTGTAPCRVAHCLINTLAQGKEEHCPALARDDMAALLSLTIETVSRTLAEFKRQGLVQEKQGVFTFKRNNLEAITLS